MVPAKVTKPAKKGPPKKTGPPKKSFDEKSKSGKLMDANKILQDWTLEAVIRAARLGARRRKMHHVEYILKQLEDDEPNSKAEELRRAEEFYKNHPRMSISTMLFWLRLSILQCVVFIP